MSFGCHPFDQNSNKNIVRISALEFFVASWGASLKLFWVSLGSNIINKGAYRNPNSFQEAPRKLYKLSGQKSLQYFCCYFGPNDNTKETFRSQLTFRILFNFVLLTIYLETYQQIVPSVKNLSQLLVLFLTVMSLLGMQQRPLLRKSCLKIS